MATQPPKISARLDRIEARIEELQVAKVANKCEEIEAMVERKVMGELEALRKVDSDYKKLVERVDATERLELKLVLEELRKRVFELESAQRLVEAYIATSSWKPSP